MKSSLQKILSGTQFTSLRLVAKKTVQQAACVVFDEISHDVLTSSIIYIFLEVVPPNTPPLAYIGQTVQQTYRRWRNHSHKADQILALIEPIGVTLNNAEKTVIELIRKNLNLHPVSKGGGLGNLIHAPGIALPYCKGTHGVDFF